MTHTFAMVVVAALLSVPIQDHHQAHGTDRARHGMGFDQQRTTHHFYIEADGGSMPLTARWSKAAPSPTTGEDRNDGDDQPSEDDRRSVER